MPELPEVETIRRGLERKIVGKTIESVEVRVPKLFTGTHELLGQQKVLKVWRKAKVLGIDISEEVTLLFHLKMTGQLIFVDGKDRFIGGHPTHDMRDELPNKTSHNIFHFTDGSTLYFNDQRKFGWVKLMSTNELKKMHLDKGMFASLGPEPLEKSFTWQALKENLLKHKSMPVKVAILDQKVVSGIGNIYACEACFNAKIDPRKRVSDLTDKEFQALHSGIIQALKDGIKYGGSSRSHFVNEEGKKGLFLDHAFVYNRSGGMCKVCGSEIKKIKLGGRGTFFCQKCQG